MFLIQSKLNKTPKVIVTGSNGRSGRGAINFLLQSGVKDKNIYKIGKRESSNIKLLKQKIGKSNILINCVSTSSTEKNRPFVTKKDIADDNLDLNVVVDVTCDYISSLHKLPFFSKGTSFKKLLIHINLETMLLM